MISALLWLWRPRKEYVKLSFSFPAVAQKRKNGLRLSSRRKQARCGKSISLNKKTGKLVVKLVG
ncbi:hypothetical protein AUK11_02995 [bacterium CG2_30_37_16]|nr:MAG: hypothetical protein AUK11_02995 [bacterium CG2_30_37_16]PIP30899.1 MAG: hypothetical protein COX25_02335 [bacterium (Candidatus Howlettbacteria) CG23_combo_of_CG06-09_8_20_14_all_37_9]PIX99684.1 MAG: hypothetical protein COZ22_01960 [bacterium (Candidatus Howlettbacteria) CG_4_10_14_3_um_filter_37_10]PJB06617.1 MAG: hypothetical protein CO123_01740 [bacterium (Candidatus Howlettbacteria) CG_4_9_14_3_um_filter_37_10]